MITPQARSAAAAPLPAACALRYGDFGIGDGGKVLCFHPSEVGGHPLGFLRLRRGIGWDWLWSQLAGMSHQKPALLLADRPVRGFDVHRPLPTLPPPALGRVALRTARFFAPQRHRQARLAPGCPRLTHRTGARIQRH
jgi:hypothetical protein